MLSQAERLRIEEEILHHEFPRGALPEALMIVQEYRGWVSDESIRDIAETLSLAAEDVEAVATFAELVYRKPVGKHVIMVCDSVSCWITGSDGILDHLRKTLGVDLGGTTADGKYTLLPAGCLGACEQAPAMLLDGELYGNLTAEAVDRILSDRGGDDARATH